jgi:hypothetical protein
MNQSLREFEQREWYAKSYGEAGADRNDLRSNRGVLLQTLASEHSFIRAFSRIAVLPSELRVLDVGCGSGASWYQLFRLGVKPVNTVVIEIQSDRLSQLGISTHMPQQFPRTLVACPSRMDHLTSSTSRRFSPNYPTSASGKRLRPKCSVSVERMGIYC